MESQVRCLKGIIENNINNIKKELENSYNCFDYDEINVEDTKEVLIARLEELQKIYECVKVIVK